MTLRQSVEENVAVWLMGTLLSGFLAGIAAYRSVQEIAGLEPYSKSEKVSLEFRAKACEAGLAQQQIASAKSADDARIASSELAACRKNQPPTAQPPTAQPPTAARSEVGNGKGPSLAGKSACIRFGDDRARDAVATRQKLESLGVRISEFAPLGKDGYLSHPNFVGYTDPTHLDAALRALDAVGSFGLGAVHSMPKYGSCDLFFGLSSEAIR